MVVLCEVVAAVVFTSVVKAVVVLGERWCINGVLRRRWTDHVDSGV